MLRSLEIRDILIIDRLDLEFQSGLNALTGETGAGKSILLDSLGFALGWRGRADLVRSGAATGEVTAVFEVPTAHAARAVLDEAGLSTEDDELILRRTNTSDGRKTAFVNDRRVSGEVLRALSATLVELHGQSDDRGLLNTRGHRALLDEFGDLRASVSALRKLWRAASDARKSLADAEAEVAELKGEEDFLRHAVEELDALTPEPGEEAVLDTRRRLMQAAQRIREDVSRAHDALGSQGAEGMVGDATRWLEGAAEAAEGALDDALTALERARTELGEAEDGVAGALTALTFDPSELEAVEERLFALRALARKHDVLPDDLGAFAGDLRGRLEALDGGADDLVRLQADVSTAEAAYSKAALDLTARRTKAARALDKAMASELAPLKMERAAFTTSVTEGTPGPDGMDEVAFTVATNPGAPAGPLNRIASGGELSRFLLALKVCLRQDADGVTMIFDEIDRGVGGATADAVGRRLARLAQGGQVLVVTHSPQVAALARHQWQVSKAVQRDVTLSRVRALDDAARVDEIARMLAGDTVTEEARAAARALLSQA